MGRLGRLLRSCIDPACGAQAVALHATVDLFVGGPWATHFSRQERSLQAATLVATATRLA